MKRSLQIVLYVASLIPLAYGLHGMFVGPAGLMLAEHVTPSLDSQYRFLSVYYISLAPIIWYLVPTIERQTTLFRIIIMILFVGGLARLYSYFTIGAPAINFVGGMVLELSLPVLLLWQAKVAADAINEGG